MNFCLKLRTKLKIHLWLHRWFIKSCWYTFYFLIKASSFFLQLLAHEIHMNAERENEKNTYTHQKNPRNNKQIASWKKRRMQTDMRGRRRISLETRDGGTLRTVWRLIVLILIDRIEDGTGFDGNNELFVNVIVFW